MYRLLPIIFGMVGQDLGAYIKRRKRNSVLYVLALLFFLTAYLSAIVAFGIYLARFSTPMEAAILIALVMVGLALFLLVLISLFNRRERRRNKTIAGVPTTTAVAGLSLLPLLLRTRPLIVLAAIGALGYGIWSGAGTEPDDDEAPED